MRHEALLEHVVQLGAATKALEALLAGLEETAARLQSQWNGAACEAYAHAHREWSGAAARMNDALATIGEIALRSHIIMAAAQRDALSVWDW